MLRTAIPKTLRPVLLAADIAPTARTLPESNLDQAALLLIASNEDGASLHLMEVALSLGIQTAFIPLETLMESSLLFWMQAAGQRSSHPAIYYRSAGTVQQDLAQCISVLEMLLPAYPGMVVHRSTRGSKNISKPWQAGIIRRAGPEVRVIPTQLLRSVKPNPCLDQIIKSVSSERSQVVRSDDTRLVQNDILAAPAQYQTRLVGCNIRVHVCGEVTIAIQINTEALDYRYLDADHRSLELITLPPEITAWCCRATMLENLEFSGIDLFRDEADQYWCFEINPMPGYHFYEQQLENHDRKPPISIAILNYLRLVIQPQ